MFIVVMMGKWSYECVLSCPRCPVVQWWYLVKMFVVVWGLEGSTHFLHRV